MKLTGNDICEIVMSMALGYAFTKTAIDWFGGAGVWILFIIWLIWKIAPTFLKKHKAL